MVAGRSVREPLAGLAARPHIKVSFGTEAGLFVAMAGIPTVVIGPGATAQAHKPDEFVEIAELERCTDVIAKLIGQCEKADGLEKLRPV